MGFGLLSWLSFFGGGIYGMLLGTLVLYKGLRRNDKMLLNTSNVRHSLGAEVSKEKTYRAHI